MGPNSCRRIALICFVLAVVTLSLYWPVRHFDFVQYDDNEYVFNNPDVSRGLSWWGLTWAFVDAHVSNWHPVTWLSHMLDCQLFGLNAGAHHVVNVVLHSANAVLLFLLLRTMTGACWRSFMVAALFAWHPLRVESVAWISERKDVLSGFFFLLTLWAYAHYAMRKRATAGTPANRDESLSQPHARDAARFYVLALAFFTLGLLSKAMLITVPFVLLLLDFWPLARFREFRIPRALLIEKIPFVALALIFSVIAFLAQRSTGAMPSLASEGITSRFANAVAAYAGYLEKTFWPQNLCVLYLRSSGPPMSNHWPAAMALIGLSAIALVCLRRNPAVAAGWSWFVVMLLPVSGLAQAGLQYMADRYTYLPSIGLFVMLVWGITELGNHVPGVKSVRYAAAAFSLAILALCCAATSRQVGYWKNTETLMGRALEIDPNNYIAHSDLAIYLSHHGRAVEAHIHYEAAERLDPATAGRSQPGANTTRTNSIPER